MNVADIMYMNARKYPAKEAIVFKDRRYNYKEIDELSNQFANTLIELGLTKGDRVAMMLKNSEFFPIVYFGIIKAGAVVVPVNFSLLKNEVQFILNNCEAKAFVTGEEFLTVLKGISQQLLTVEHLICIGEHTPSETLNYYEITKKQSKEAPYTKIDEEDLCEILYTSGTTGTPRGAVFKHKNVLWTIIHTGCLSHRIDLHSRTLNMMPLFHSAPLHLYFLGTIYMGGTNVILDVFDPRVFLETIEKEKTTLFFGPAVVYLTCAKSFDLSKYDFSTMEMFVLGGSPISAEDINLVLDSFSLRGKNKLQQVYGFTEGGPTGMPLRPDEIETKPASIGKAGLTSTELRIADSKGNTVPAGVVGEIVVRSDSVMVEYYKDPEKTAASFFDDWFRTGDLAWYDEDGYIYFADRSKDMIISGGQNVYSKEIEDILMQHPAVMMVAVIGVPDPDWGESVKGVVSLKAGCSSSEDELIEFCKTRLAKFKCPRIIQIVNEIPHNPAGKIVKPEVRKLYGHE
ncbi:MAG: long-chain-fatty-acid--CoA ligase [Bacillota bacterium]|nr:long-chain-fatty-acid--CoA ligase [Bacillota bacterium]